jgi:hypothetical protein
MDPFKSNCYIVNSSTLLFSLQTSVNLNLIQLTYLVGTSTPLNKQKIWSKYGDYQKTSGYPRCNKLHISPDTIPFINPPAGFLGHLGKDEKLRKDGAITTKKNL